ncbi:hypothetical protein Adu01nite_12950 [Paractinoplanes durhamensis]|uniref:Uncharacterized protein n=1 Tax=Paractinoplanes durhamensis TaxID=113563 RepID=A0ABQ3YQS7_9ACTN|nr:hypothetical protein Adu01nite_12950 [Actinoplanes durhamensis]
MRFAELAEILSRPISQELLGRDLTRLAYVAKDGTPRNVPTRWAPSNASSGRRRCVRCTTTAWSASW